MNVRVKVHLESFNRLSTKVVRFGSSGILVLGANEITTAIKRNTFRGVDPDGNPLAGYSDSWKKVRRKAGKQTAHVDFRFAGGMMRSLGPRQLGRSNSITISVAPEFLAQAEGLHFGNKNLPARRWLDFSDSTVDAFLNKSVIAIEKLHG